MSFIGILYNTWLSFFFYEYRENTTEVLVEIINKLEEANDVSKLYTSAPTDKVNLIIVEVIKEWWW